MKLYDLGFFIILAVVASLYMSGTVKHDVEQVKPTLKIGTEINPKALLEGEADYSNLK